MTDAMPRPARPWFRMWSELANSLKFDDMPDRLVKPWIKIMCLANITEPRGSLPSFPKVAYALRVKEDKAKGIVAALVNLRFIDCVNGRYFMHDWEDWQRQSDYRDGDDRNPKRADSAPVVPHNGGDSAPITPHREEESRAEGEGDKEERGEPRSRRRPLSQVEGEIPRLIDQHPTLNVPDEFVGWNLWRQSKNKTYIDYVAAFETWLRNEEKYARQRPQVTRGTAGNASERAAAILAGNR